MNEPRYIIPQSLIDNFVSVAMKNTTLNKEGKLMHLETLAYISGYEKEGKIYGNEVIFPQQTCHGDRVDDDGKPVYNVNIFENNYNPF